LAKQRTITPEYMENTKLDDTDKSVPYGHYAAHNIIFHFSTTC
jgi:hypothetical protein